MRTWARRSKYGAQRTVRDGVTFASKWEAECYQTLRLRQMAGEEFTLELHPSWPLVVNGERIGRYTGDFLLTYPSGEIVVIDAKGGPTSRDYVLRRKLLRALYGIEVQEWRRERRRTKRRAA